MEDGRERSEGEGGMWEYGLMEGGRGRGMRDEGGLTRKGGGLMSDGFWRSEEVGWRRDAGGGWREEERTKAMDGIGRREEGGTRRRMIHNKKPEPNTSPNTAPKNL